jgi:hypothetical protein
MRTTMKLSNFLCDLTKGNLYSRKTISRQFPGTIFCAVLVAFLLVMAVPANAQTPMAYDFLGYSDDWGTIDLTTGAFNQTGNSSELFAGLGVGPGGLLYGGLFEGTTLYQVSPADGSVTTVGTSSLSYYDFGSTTTGVYGFDSTLNLYSVNTTTGATTLIGPTGISTGGSGAISASTGADVLYFTDGSGNLHSINTSTGTATEIGNTGAAFGAMVFENGTLYAGTAGSSPYYLYTLNPTTGTATLVATASAGPFWGLAPSVFPVAGLSPSSLKLASTLVGQSSASSTVTVTNSGSVSLSISTVSVSGDFSETDTCAEQTIQPTDTCTVSVTFTPSVTGSITGALTIVDNAANTPQVLALSGSGLPDLSISPASENFGTVTVGTTSAAKTMTLTNNTSGTLNYTFLASANYTVVGSGKTPCNGALAKKAKCTVSVTFTPTANGAGDGSLAVSSGSFPTQLAGLSGTGSGGATAPLTFSPSTFKVANTVVGASSSAVTVTVTNSSASTVNITNFVASSDYSVIGSGATPCGGTLGAGDSCTVAVTFSPSIAGKLSGSVVFMDNASVNTQIYDLSATGVLPVTFAPASLTFASQALGKTSAAKSITLTNNQASPLTLTSIEASGQYSAAAGGKKPCGSSVSAHGTCTFEVTFTPAQAGTIPGAVTVTTNASGSPQTIKLSGTGQ